MNIRESYIKCERFFMSNAIAIWVVLGILLLSCSAISLMITVRKAGNGKVSSSLVLEQKVRDLESRLNDQERTLQGIQRFLLEEDYHKVYKALDELKTAVENSGNNAPEPNIK